MRPSHPPAFSRRTFLFFLVLGPLGLLTIFAIIVATQYVQYKGMVSSRENVPEFAWSGADQARLEAVLASLRDFSAGTGPDSLRLAPGDLTMLAASSAAAKRQGIRFRISADSGLLVVESTQRIDSMRGRLSWIFRKITPPDFRWLNARMEGSVEWKDGNLGFSPERGFLNGAKVPRAALTRRGGMSPKDFLDPKQAPEYNVFLAALDTVEYQDGDVVLMQKRIAN